MNKKILNFLSIFVLALLINSFYEEFLLANCANDKITCRRQDHDGGMYGVGHYYQGAKWSWKKGGCCTIIAKNGFIDQCNQTVQACEGRCDSYIKFYMCAVD